MAKRKGPKILEGVALDFCDVVLEPPDKLKKFASRTEFDPSLTMEFRWSSRKAEGVPIIAANMNGVGTPEMARAFKNHGMTVALSKHVPREEIEAYYETEGGSSVWYSMGLRAEDWQKFQIFKSNVGRDNIPQICLDVPNAYLEGFIDLVSRVRHEVPNAIIMAGNVVGPKTALKIIKAGADVIKLGVGPGSVCTTRVTTGIGMPQLQTLFNCVPKIRDSKHGDRIKICADGGCATPGDFSKAFAAGADYVMAGGIFAGHAQAGKIETDTGGNRFVVFYGSSSEEAMNVNLGGRRARQAPEGRVVRIPYRGDVERVLEDIEGYLCSAGTYLGARNLAEFPENARFKRVNRVHSSPFSHI